MDNIEAVSKVFKALGEPNRLRIIEALTEKCSSVTEIAEKASISQPLASHHLDALAKAGLARMQNYGNFHYY